MASAKNKKASVNAGPARGFNLISKMKQVDTWRENFNPLAGLIMARARTLLEQGLRGEFADLQWTYKFVEERYPILSALIERRTSALLELDWNIKITPENKRADDFDEALAEDQAACLRQAYDRLDNLYDAIEHFGLASFRGFAHVQKQDIDGDGLIDHLEILDQWNWVRRGLYGAWYYNEKAISANWRYFESQGPIDENDFLIRCVKRSINPIALIAFIRWSLGKKDRTGFIEIFGIPGGVVILPPNVPAEKESEYVASAEQIAKGGSGALPNGSDYKSNDTPRGVDPFERFIASENEDVVLAGTGGLLTMLAMSGSGTLAGGAHQETFKKIAKAEAKKISELFNRGFDKAELEREFPGKPVLAYWELAANEQTNTSEAVKDIATLSAAGFEVDEDEASEKTGYTLTRKPVAPPQSFPFPNRRIANRKFEQAVATLETNVLQAYGKAKAKALQPVINRLEEIQKISDPATQRQALQQFHDDLPALAKNLKLDSEMSKTLLDGMASAIRNGLEQTREATE